MPLTVEARALAAEKTVAILKAKVRSLYNGDTNSVQRQLERAKQRQEETRRRQELMAVRNQELQRYSEILEKEVAQRTRDIKTILDNVTFGFLVVGADLVVRDGHTESCHTLLTQEAVSGRYLPDLLGVELCQRTELELGVEQVFDDLLPEELTLEQLPHRFTPSPGRVIHLDARTIRGDAGEVQALLVTLSDTTALELAQHEADHNRILIGLLRRKEAFERFVLDAREQFAAARSFVSSHDIPRLRRALHTVKGNAAIFGLNRVAACIHEAEGSLDITLLDVDECEEALRAFLVSNVEVLDLVYDQVEAGAVEVPIPRLRDLQRRARSGAGPEEVDAWVLGVMLRPARSVLGPIAELVARLADRLDKRVEFVLSGEEVLVEGERLRPVIQNLAHIIRNAVDHGIENPEERGDKPSVGRVALDVAEHADELWISVEDDGRGIDTRRVVERAMDKGLVSRDDAECMGEQELLRLIYLDGLTTARAATDISGRGVGMSSVLSAVTELGGTVDVASHPGRGTRITLRIPRRMPTTVAAE